MAKGREQKRREKAEKREGIKGRIKNTNP